MGPQAFSSFYVEGWPGNLFAAVWLRPHSTRLMAHAAARRRGAFEYWRSFAGSRDVRPVFQPSNRRGRKWDWPADSIGDAYGFKDFSWSVLSAIVGSLSQTKKRSARKMEENKITVWGSEGGARSMFGVEATEEYFDSKNEALFSRYGARPEDGVGSMYYLFNNEINVMIMDGELTAPQNYRYKDGGWISFGFHINLQAVFSLSEGKKIEAADLIWALFRFPEGSEREISIPAGERLRWVSICCKRELIEEMVGNNLEGLLGKKCEYILEESNYFLTFKFNSMMLQSVEEIFKINMPMRLRSNFIRTKAYELITLALNCFLEASKENTDEEDSSEFVQNSIERAAWMIDGSLRDPPTLEALSKSIGLSKSELISQFKSRYGCDLSDYIKEKKLAEAKRLLEKTRMPLSEIASRIGYRHQCNLSTAFRAKFGVTPLVYRKNSLKG